MSQKQSVRYPSRFQVSSIVIPIFSELFHRVHSRLRLQTSNIFRPTESELEIDRRVHIQIYAGSNQNAFSQRFEKEIRERPEILDIHLAINRLEMSLQTAQTANDDFAAEHNAEFRTLLTSYYLEKERQAKKSLMNLKHPRDLEKAFRRSQRIEKTRDRLNQLLRNLALEYPSPLRLEDAPDGGSIEELENQIRHLTQKRDENISRLKKDKSLTREVLKDYICRHIGFRVIPDGFKKILDLISQGRCSIYELETFDEASNIQTDTEGLPIDFEMPSPIKINMDVLRLAAEAESGTETIRERFHAFSAYPNGVLAGESKDGRLDLVFIPASVLNVILEFEEEWIRHVDEYILSTYASPAPVTGAEKQARQESFDRSDRSVPANTPNEPEQEDLPRFSLPEINGNSSNPPAHGNTTD